MVERIDEMPGDTLGFRLSGKLGRDEYFQILDPVKEKLERGEAVSFLIRTAPDFSGARPGCALGGREGRGIDSRSSPTRTGCATRSPRWAG
jgi:hypothetical protein